MRWYKVILQEAELMAMSPESVAAFLKRRGNQPLEAESDHPTDAAAEEALRRRAEPLIDLALARYGQHIEVVSRLFRSAASGSPIRVACLANRSLGREILPGFPVGLLGTEPSSMVEWLGAASDAEISALFGNPNLSNDFLVHMLERRNGWESITNDNLLRIVIALGQNPRMWTPEKVDWPATGGVGEGYSRVFDAAWKLAETAPLTRDWAACLGLLYDKLEPEGLSVINPLVLANRWHADPNDQEAEKREAACIASGFLGEMQRVRKGLARLALNQTIKEELRLLAKNHQVSDQDLYLHAILETQRVRRLIDELLSSDDVAMRAAAYAAGHLGVAQIRAAHDKDGEVAYYEAINNPNLWMGAETRQTLADFASRCPDLSAIQAFDSVEKAMRTAHPEWFIDAREKNEDLAANVEIAALLNQLALQSQSLDQLRSLGESLQKMLSEQETPSKKADLSSLSAQIGHHGQYLESLGQHLRSLARRAGWIWWFSLGALLASLRPF